MATLTVFKFANPEGANQMLDKVTSLQKMELIKIQDAAIVTWPAGQKAPKTKQLVNMAGMGAMQGAFWGMLFGLIFFIPFFGAAVTGRPRGAASWKEAIVSLLGPLPGVFAGGALLIYAAGRPEPTALMFRAAEML